MPDHVHLLIGLKPSQSISDLVRDIKAASSGWINERRLVIGKFNWQDGYGAFSYSKKELPKVINYILNQEEHHYKKKFKEEYIVLLKEMSITFEDKYLFDWIE